MRLLPGVLLTFFVSACAPAAPPAPEPLSGPAESEITTASLTAHLRALSSDLFEGRAPATRGGRLAEEYLATQLAALGLEPAGGPGLTFVTMPNVFNQMPFGTFFGVLFYILFYLAALSSWLGGAEAVAASYMEEFGLSRKDLYNAAIAAR